MIDGHGDDAYRYGHIRVNFSSNVYTHVNHDSLNGHLFRQMACIRTYPEPEPYTLERELAARYRVAPENVCVTNGATEAIYLIAQAWRGSRSAILMPTFSEYADACRLHVHEVEPVFTLDALSGRTSLVWLCNPNNPTGEVRPADRLRRLIEEHPRQLFVIDQSYEAFTLKEVLGVGETAALPNVLLLHSMTKRFAVPGLRLGYLTGHKDLLQKLRRYRMPWSVNALAIEAGTYLLRHVSAYQLDLNALLAERQRVAGELENLGGIEVWPSDTHYMLLRLRGGKASALKEWLADTHGLLIRDASNFEGLDEGFFRIAVQTPEENNQLITAIKEWMYQY